MSTQPTAKRRRGMPSGAAEEVSKILIQLRTSTGPALEDLLLVQNDEVT